MPTSFRVALVFALLAAGCSVSVAPTPSVATAKLDGSYTLRFDPPLMNGNIFAPAAGLQEEVLDVTLATNGSGQLTGQTTLVSGDIAQRVNLTGTIAGQAVEIDTDLLVPQGTKGKTVLHGTLGTGGTVTGTLDGVSTHFTLAPAASASPDAVAPPPVPSTVPPSTPTPSATGSPAH